MRRLDRDGYGQLLLSWVAGELSGIYRQHVDPAPKGHLLLGCAVWGKAYVERFLQWTVPTLRANHAALKGRSRMVLFTDTASFDLLWHYAREMQASGVPTQIILIPELLLAQLAKRDDNKYMLLGAVQNLSVQMAARAGTGFHALFPDGLFSENYFANLFRLAETHPAIAHVGFSADLNAIPEARSFEKDGAWSIPGIELGDMGWRHMHDRSLGNLMNRGTELLGYPPSHCCIWQGPDRLSYYCCHSNATFMSAELCAKAPVRFFSPIDANLPYMMDTFYTPRLEDDMVLLEVSDGTMGSVVERPDAETFAATCWYWTNFRDDYLPYFATPTDIPIKPQRAFIPVAEIRERQAAITADIVARKEDVRGRIAFKDVA